MIELAPQHKNDLILNSPVMPAAGFFGYGEPHYANVISANQFGALVTNPITLRPCPHQATPQVIESNGGVIFNTLPRNFGVRNIIRRYDKFWRRASIPIIAHLPADDPADLARTAGALAGLDSLAAFELGLPHSATPHDVKTAIRAIQQRSELPLLVKLPLPELTALAEAALAIGADTLVISAASLSAAYTTAETCLRGNYYGPGIVPQNLSHLADLHQRYPQVPLIACGGIHTLADVKAYLKAGAKAIQLDTLIFTDPAQVQQILGVSYD